MGQGHGAAWGCGWWRQERDRHHLDPRSPGPWSGAMGQLCCGCVGETEAEAAGGWQSQKSAEDTTLASVSRRVVETAISRAVQQYLRESTTEPRDKLADPALDPAPPEDNGAVADAGERRANAN
ncbi:A-kinase anchor protein 7-like isoform X2 [Lethenteron reissneri]|uniref:A-kinase anchor protein 7-like isoform X2 n=1 Tax=Lethenteron reissneri TaxID=7753 RepID=UPI002AB5EF69|nr:A-kinase anchor protein 7-like isoform X2 [Lethenteron reissneri]